MTHTPDKTLLTAYALNEVSEEKRKEIEAWLKSDKAARHFVDETRATAEALSQAYAQEPDVALTTEQREVLVAQLKMLEEKAPRKMKKTWGSRLMRAAICLFIVGILAAIFLPTLTRQREAARITTKQDILNEIEACKAANERGFVLETWDVAQLKKRAEWVGLTDEYEQLKEEVLKDLPGSAKQRYAEAEEQLRTLGYLTKETNVRFEKDALGSLYSNYSIAEDTRQHPDPNNTEAYNPIVENPFQAVLQEPLSTFSIDVDTASYANVRRYLNQGHLPPPDAVRIEEFINYFDYGYAPPTGDTPFAAHTAIATCPWNPGHRLARIAIKGLEISSNERPASNLVFLVDVSGSMSAENKLPLVQESLRMLTEKLGARDRVALAVYAGSSGLVLPSTSGNNKEAIRAAIASLQSGGSTHGSAGIQLAYEVAQEHFLKGGVNRVILATDGDFNVGLTDQGSLIRLIEEEAQSGVYLTVLGFGMGNYKDGTMEQLADKGNGNYAYIDTENEARKVLVNELSGALVTIAKDVKIQIEFNPAQVGAYRLIGYENRMLAARDFNDDQKDAGEIGAGHTVTALYELVPPGEEAGVAAVDPLKYQPASTPAGEALSAECFTLKLRYKRPDGDVSKLLEFPVSDAKKSMAEADPDFQFAASVAAFGMILRDSRYRGAATFERVLELAENAIGQDPNGYRREFLRIVRRAQELKQERSAMLGDQ